MSISGYTYEGGWVNDREEGEGEEHYEDGSIFKGHFRKGKKDGFGRLEQPDGSYYSGEFHDNAFNGFGEYVWPRQRYKGDWLNSEVLFLRCRCMAAALTNGRTVAPIPGNTGSVRSTATASLRGPTVVATKVCGVMAAAQKVC